MANMLKHTSDNILKGGYVMKQFEMPEVTVTKINYEVVTTDTETTSDLPWE